MSAQILDGKTLASKTKEELRHRVEVLRHHHIHPRLDALVASQDPASLSYVRMKKKWAQDIGVISESYMIDESWSQAKLAETIAELNEDPTVHGVLLQHPLPPHLDEDAALLALGADKDVDGITPASLGRLVADLPGFRCATPFGIIRILEHYGIPLQGKRAVVIGRSVIVGKPMALMLLQKNATVTIAHSKTAHLPELCQTADILVAAVGRPEMVKKEWIKHGAVVIDAGYNKVEGRKTDVGDVDFEGAAEIASWITPVPGGVGPMTVATLLANTVMAAERLLK